MEKKRFTVKLNNIDKIEQLLQETYDQANRDINQIQEEINKIANTTIINELDIDGKGTYGKIMSSYITLKQKALQQKFDISKLMAEVMKHNGDVSEAINDTKSNMTSLDLTKLKELAKNANSSQDTTKEQYNLKK